MEEKTAHEYVMFSCLQNTDGRQGDASGRTKNSEQSSVQQLKAQRNPEEIRKQRVNIWKLCLWLYLWLCYWYLNRSLNLHIS